MDGCDEMLLAGRRVLLLNWRDLGNPEGGGAELYLDKMAVGLARRGCDVTYFSAAYPGAQETEERDGVRYLRRGTKLTVYPAGLRTMRADGPWDLVVDVQNGIPFFTRLARRGPVVVLVHHVHREQWPIVYPGLPGRIGWFLESQISPRVYRGTQYIAVSRATRSELQALGVPGSHIAVVHNGTAPVVPVAARKSSTPTLCVVGRLVPHKRVEHAIDAALQLRARHPGLRLHVVGSGWWEEELRGYAAVRGAGDTVVFEGHVTERRKQEIYARCWALALPSLKEGWGLVIGEAAMHGTPAVAYRSAGGTQESIEDQVSGILVDRQADFTAALGLILDDEARRMALSSGAREHGEKFTWEHSQAAFAHVVAAAIRGELIQADDEVE